MRSRTARLYGDLFLTLYALATAQAGRRQRRTGIRRMRAGWSRLRYAQWRDCYFEGWAVHLRRRLRHDTDH